MIDAIPFLAAYFILLGTSAFFSGSEAALFSIHRFELKKFAEKYPTRGKQLHFLKRNQRKTIISLLLGSNVANITASAIATVLAIEYGGDELVGISTGVTTLLVLMFTDMIPKTFAAQRNRAWLFLATPIIYLMYHIFLPFSLFFDFFVRFIGEAKTKPFTEDELKEVLDFGLQENVIDRYEKMYFENILALDKKPISTLVLPLHHVAVVSGEWNVLKTSQFIAKKSFSRYPVYQGTRNNIIGIIRSHEILKAMSHGDVNVRISTLMFPSISVGEKDSIATVFRMFQKNHVQLGIVMRPDNTIRGFVTMEDILEQIVGDIYDEEDPILDGE